MTSMLGHDHSCASSGTTWTSPISSISGGGSTEPELIAGLPVGLVRRYARAAAYHYEPVELEPGHWFVSVRGFDGAWGEGSDLATALADLEETIVGWVALKRKSGASDIPVVEGLDLNESADGRTT